MDSEIMSAIQNEEKRINKEFIGLTQDMTKEEIIALFIQVTEMNSQRDRSLLQTINELSSEKGSLICANVYSTCTQAKDDLLYDLRAKQNKQNQSENAKMFDDTENSLPGNVIM